MRPRGSPDKLEARRRKAMELLDQGLSLKEVAGILKCGPSSVLRWRNQVRLYGEDALKARPVPGRPPKLNKDQQQLLKRLILHGAVRNGFESDGWTTSRIAALIKKKFKISYHRDHIGRLMDSLGFHYVRSSHNSRSGTWQVKEPSSGRPGASPTKPPTKRR